MRDLIPPGADARTSLPVHGQVPPRLGAGTTISTAAVETTSARESAALTASIRPRPSDLLPGEGPGDRRRTRARGGRRTRRGTTAAVTVGLALAGWLVAFGAPPSAGAVTAVPYTDPSAVGYIGLCNQAGQQITSGNVDTAPLAWRAVSSAPALAPYNDAGRTAILQAFQPQNGLPPADWSGQQMTASSRYSNPANPMAAATAGDSSLADFLMAFPARWDGFVQLRMYLGTTDQEPYEIHYPVLDIQVTGDTWTAVGGGPVNCNSGTSESIETILLPKSTATTTSPTNTDGATAKADTTGSSTSPTTKPAIASDSRSSSVGHNDPAVIDAAHPTSPWLTAGFVAAIVLVVGLLVFFTRRRLATHSDLPEPDVSSNSTTKGQQS